MGRTLRTSGMFISRRTHSEKQSLTGPEFAGPHQPLFSVLDEMAPLPPRGGLYLHRGCHSRETDPDCILLEEIVRSSLKHPGLTFALPDWMERWAFKSRGGWQRRRSVPAGPEGRGNRSRVRGAAGSRPASE
jgi:hypothetical protein